MASLRSSWVGACALLLLAAAGALAEDILIKGGTVVNADRQFKADVLIRDGLILKVAPGLKAVAPGTRELDATGKLVMPGGIDPHTHLSMPFMGQVTCDDFFTGHAAALAGGTTMHIDFALPVNHDLMAGWEEWQKKAEAAAMDYGFHMAVTAWSDKVAADMAALTQRGVNSFKFFMAYKGALMVNDEQLLQGFRRCKELGAVPQVHAENGDAVAEGQQRVFDAGITGPEGHALSRPPELEGEATARAIRLAEFVGSPLYVVHVMSREAQEEIARARQRGQRVIGETVASAISMDESRMWDPDFKVAAQYVMSPPIRSKEHGAALRAALAGGLLQLVGTDHAVFNSTQKSVGRHDFRIIPNGVNGLEERMHVVWQELVNSGLLSPSDFVRVTSTAAAQVFNVYPRKGVVAEGSDADVIILDPVARHTISAKAHHSAMDTNIYEGYEVTGKVVTTVSRGRLVWHNGQLNVTRGSGRFVPTPPFGPLYDGLDRQSPYLLDVARYGGVPGLLDNPWLKSGIISGSLSLAGDVLAQLLTLRGQQQQGSSTSSSGGYDVPRAARMGSFGLLFYGPYQHWWYGLLARTFPGTSIPMFATKVALNQLCLAPITITVAFTWNLALTGQLDQLPGKLRRDFLRTMINGWRFWVPAATINFKLIPLQYQVLYMSTCGMLWTGYLSYQSAAQAK